LEDIEMSETVTRRDHAERVRDYYREQGATAEQQRIIELLKEMQGTSLASQTDEGNKTAWVLENAIVLIKGDN
jgi:hypothetical protein